VFGSGSEFGRAWFIDMNLSSFLGAGWVDLRALAVTPRRGHWRHETRV
jgi:hypothetical protein